MRSYILVAAVAVLVLGCKAKAKPTAALVDLTATGQLAPVRAAFNAKKGEARFLTLLSPT